MRKLVLMLSVFSFLNCSSTKKLKVETIEATYVASSRTNERGAHIRYRKRIPFTDILEPKIINIKQENKILRYDIQGHITSGGHTINRIKTIKTEKDVIENTLYIRHNVLIKRIPGKEGANIMGQNYKYDYCNGLNQQIKRIKIQILHQYTSKEKTDTLVVEDEIIVNK